MSENANVQSSKSKSTLEWEDWVVTLTGGVITSSAIGYIVYKGLKSNQLDIKAVMTIASSFVGGLGIYFTSSAVLYMCRESMACRRESTTKIDESNLSVRERETAPWKKFVDEPKEMDRRFDCDVCNIMNRRDLDKISRDNQRAEVPCKLENITKRSNDLNEQLKLSTHNQMETFYNEYVEIRRTKLDEIISCIIELKGYVQGTVDSAPLARNVQFQSFQMSDEMRRKVVAILKEYTNSLIPKFEKIIKSFLESVHEPKEVLNNKEYNLKKALGTLTVSEKDQSRIFPKMDSKQDCDVPENATKSRPQTFQNWQGSKNVLGMQPHDPLSSSSLHEIKAWKKIPENQSPMMTKLEKAITASSPLKSQDLNKIDHRAVEKLKNQCSNAPEKLTLNQEQIRLLNILKSEI